MIYIALVVLGLCAGSFVNALVWRIHEQEKTGKKKPRQINKASRLSIINGRSMCPHCKHELSADDLFPVISWVWLRGRCRYCQKKISWQYPTIELLTAILFVGSYLFWSYGWDWPAYIQFVLWLVLLTGFMALMVYDLKWMILPNRIVYPLTGVAAVMASNHLVQERSIWAVGGLILSLIIAGGIFHGLFQLSKGKWIGGGDIKLGYLLGFLLVDPSKAFLMLLGASLLGTLIVLPGLALRKLTTRSRVPFGPFLIVSGILVFIFGTEILDWYRSLIIVG